jgi:trk system potassium uptake protein TrkH
VYVGLTLSQALLFMLGGMEPFDAINHSFSTLATGGFSTKNASLAAYDSAYIHWVTIAFMYMAGINFALHFKAATGRPVYFRDQEWRFFTLIILAGAAVIAAANLWSGDYTGLEPALRDALFQSASITTTTGFVSADYELWAPGAQMVLFTLFFVGGMAGSTAGGIKTMRVLLLLKQTSNELRKNLHPRAILLTRVGTQPVKEDVLANVVGFVILYLLLCAAGSLLLGLMGSDPLTAISGSLAVVGNVGPGFGRVGAVDNYGWMSGAELSVLSFLMLAGRLEIYTVLLLFHPETWKARKSYH